MLDKQPKLRYNKDVKERQVQVSKTERTNTMANKKMTKKEMFTQLMANYNLKADEIEFINHEIELLEKRNSKGGDRKPTAKQKENTDLKTVILEWLTERAGEKFTITDMQKNISELAEMSNQKISSLVRQLVLENLIVREENKRKAYFSVDVID